MGEALMIAALDIPSAPRFARSEPAAPARLPGEWLRADEWHEVAAHLDRVAASIPRRMGGKDRFSSALAAFIAREVRQAAAEIRVNVALKEQDLCAEACSHG